MKAENINKTLPQLRVLVAPLDWGLGHATRCIPIIKHLISNGAEVILAAEGACRKLLSAEFPALRMLELRGYRVKYQQKKKSFTLQILRQIPNLFKTVRYENKWLEEIVTKEKIQVVISDNRYGLYNANAYTIFITHQLRIKSGSNFIDNFLQRINYNYIKRFNECWVPDEEKAPGLAHGLSHPKKLPAIPVKYMGILSRFEKHEMAEAKFHWLLLLSGPEPQRTIWEKMLVNHARTFEGTVAVVRGLLQGGEKIDIPANWELYDHLPSKQLNEIVQNSSSILCRSGYSTLMDLRACGKKALIVPTPGQKEQEYLAEKNNGRFGFISAVQSGEKLKVHLKEIENLPEPLAAKSNIGNFIEDWLTNFSQSLQVK